MEQPTAQREGYGNAVLTELPDPQSHFPAPKGTVRKVIFFICHSARTFTFFAGRENVISTIGQGQIFQK